MRGIVVCAATLVGVTVMAACQTYDFEPVEPFAFKHTTQRKVASRLYKPNVMLLVDKSKSMDFPVTVDTCQPGCGHTTLCYVDDQCHTRWSDLSSATRQFLAQHGTVARFGLTFFPEDRGVVGGVNTQCDPARSVRVEVSDSDDVDSELQAQADQISQQIGQIVDHETTDAGTDQANGNIIGGGTPTGQSLAFVGNDPHLNDSADNRQDFVLMLTDGLPNCNGDNPNNCVTSPPDVCQLQSDSCCNTLQTNCGNMQCLDRDATVQHIAQLRAQGISTIVVGFGTETSDPAARPTLEAMAQAGGFIRTCPGGTDAECGTGTCDAASKVCSPTYFQAADATQLAQALNQIADQIGACTIHLLDSPTDPTLVSVSVNGAGIAAGPNTWSFVPPNLITLNGTLCDRAKRATPDNPVDIEVHVLDPL